MSKATYEKIFYMEIKGKQGRLARHRQESKCYNATGKPFIYGFPCTLGAWCNSKLKVAALDKAKSELSRPVLQEVQSGKEDGQNSGVCSNQRKLVYERTKKQGDKKFYRNCEGEVVQYIGIAFDETVRVERHKDKPNILMPLVEVGWTEADCKQWCIDNDLLSPIYSTSMRGGCWFCHNQSVDQLRLLRRDYPDLWALLLKWDIDSPVTFKADGHTVHDFDKRFYLEDIGVLRAGDRKFKWKMLDEELNYSLF